MVPVHVVGRHANVRRCTLGVQRTKEMFTALECRPLFDWPSLGVCPATDCCYHTPMTRECTKILAPCLSFLDGTNPWVETAPGGSPTGGQFASNGSGCHAGHCADRLATCPLSPGLCPCRGRLPPASANPMSGPSIKTWSTVMELLHIGYASSPPNSL